MPMGATDQLDQTDQLPHFVAGVAAGMAEWFVGHPLDTIRIRVIAGSQANGGYPVGGTFKQLYKGFSSVQGVLSLYRGSLADVLAAAVGGSFLFGVNNALRKLFGAATIGSNREQYEGVTSKLLLSAAGTGFFDALAYKPLGKLI